ncbi:MAG: YidC/Oxa1 family membrane protein insertase [Dehalococcoidia bacterium]
MGVLIGFIWNQVLLGPATNFIVVLDRLLFGSYGLAIIVFTLVLRGLTMPLTLRQMQSSKKMSKLQPRIQEIQKKYGSDAKKKSEATMALYKEEGVNPAGCLIPTLIQFPIWIALYQVIRITLGTTPESLIDLSHRLYPWSFVQHAVPLTSHFLWLNLGARDTTYIMPVLVFITMWLQQKLTMTPATMQPNSQTAQTNQMMLWMMPAVFAWFSLTVPSGLAVYWVITNFAGIALNYFVFDWHTKPLSEALGLRDFSLAGIAAAFAPKPRAGARPAPSRNGRPPVRTARETRPNLPQPRQETDGGDAGPERPAGPGRRRNAATPQRKQQPKAPPVARPARPSTGRLGSDPAGSNGGPETRSRDGRNS